MYVCLFVWLAQLVMADATPTYVAQVCSWLTTTKDCMVKVCGREMVTFDLCSPSKTKV